MTRSLRTRTNDRGIVAIELVLALPFLLALVFGTVALGGLLSTKNRTVGAARDGARAAALSQALPSPAGITVTRTSAACPPRTDPSFNTANVTVQAVGTYVLHIPFFAGNATKTITETVTFRCGG
jgi:Flp pilus assembly protein TadG